MTALSVLRAICLGLADSAIRTPHPGKDGFSPDFDLLAPEFRITNIQQNPAALDRWADRVNLRVERIKRRFDLVSETVS
jgi:hypothetical protein